MINNDEVVQSIINQQNKEDAGEFAEEDKDEEQGRMSHTEGKAAALQL